MCFAYLVLIVDARSTEALHPVVRFLWAEPQNAQNQLRIFTPLRLVKVMRTSRIHVTMHHAAAKTLSIG